MAEGNGTGTPEREGNGQWKPGVSGNPGGKRGLALAPWIRAQTREGEELVAYVVTVFRNPRLPHARRMEAATWLADRGWGRPHQSASVDHAFPADMRYFPPGTRPQDVDAPAPSGDNGHAV